MQPFGAVEKIKETYQRFVETSFPLADEGLRKHFKDLVQNEHLLWQDPFVSLFENGGTLTDLVNAGFLSREIVNRASYRSPHWKFAQLYAHQRTATERLSSLNRQSQNTLITTGTGSGKTESFLISIIDHCMRHPQRGIQAVIVYPMNALVNDQLRRLRELLPGTGVSFARYTGNTPDEERPDDGGELVEEERQTRQEIRRNPAQILLTNYMMLEQLLLRESDRRTFHFVQPRYLVLDEVHTYTGILGAEVACLIRRFKEHANLERGQLCCVGTSATVMPSQKNGTESDSQKDLLDFASNLFGEEFAPDSILTEKYRPFNRTSVADHLEDCPVLTDDLLKDIDIRQEEQIRVLANCFQIEMPMTLHGDAFFHRLYEEIDKRLIFSLFEEWLEKPNSLDTLVEKLAERTERVNIPRERLKLEAMAVLLLGSAASRKLSTDEEPEPRYRPKVHFNMRSMTPLSMSFNLAGRVEKLLSEGQTEHNSHNNHVSPTETATNGHAKGNDDKKALPLAVCRSCGTSYLKGYYDYDELLEQETTRGSKRKGRQKSGSALPDQLSLKPNQPHDRTFRELYILLLPEEKITDEEAAEISPEDLVEDERSGQSRKYRVCPYCLRAQAVEDAIAATELTHDEHCPGKEQKELPVFF